MDASIFNPSSPETAGLHTDIEYTQAGGESLLLDAFNPGTGQPAPVVIVLHGGGWSSGSKSGDITPVLEPLSKAGFAWVSINYRLAPMHRWPACYEDVETALNWVREHAAEYGGDPQRIALLGYSAGGHLACRAGIRANPRVQAVVGIAAPTDIVADMARRDGLSPSMKNLLDSEVIDDAVHARLVEMSPINDIVPGLPPFLLIHGTADQSVPFDQSIQLRKRLQEVGGVCDLIELQDASHTIANWPQVDPEYLDKMVDWLGARLDRSSVR
jgi:acetyl esterase/lipase